MHVARVRVWRPTHPGSWRAYRRCKPSALQDALVLQVFEGPMDFTGFALTDGLGLQDPVLIELIAQLIIAVTVRRHCFAVARMQSTVRLCVRRR